MSTTASRAPPAPTAANSPPSDAARPPLLRMLRASGGGQGTHARPRLRMPIEEMRPARSRCQVCALRVARGAWWGHCLGGHGGEKGGCFREAWLSSQRGYGSVIRCPVAGRGRDPVGVAAVGGREAAVLRVLWQCCVIPVPPPPRAGGASGRRDASPVRALGASASVSAAAGDGGVPLPAAALGVRVAAFAHRRVGFILSNVCPRLPLCNGSCRGARCPSRRCVPVLGVGFVTRAHPYQSAREKILYA